MWPFEPCNSTLKFPAKIQYPGCCTTGSDWQKYFRCSDSFSEKIKLHKIPLPVNSGIPNLVQAFPEPATLWLSSGFALFVCLDKRIWGSSYVNRTDLKQRNEERGSLLAEAWGKASSGEKQAGKQHCMHPQDG